MSKIEGLFFVHFPLTRCPFLLRSLINSLETLGGWKEMKSKMRSLIVVEGKILIDRCLVDPRILSEVVQTLFLDRSVESLQVCIVVGFSYAGMTMGNASMRRKPLRKF